MDALRTPDARFADLPDFPWEPRYLDVPSGDGGTLRMAYIDEGPRDAPLVLMLHGEPSWSFLYRKVIKVVLAAGLRAVAPDLIGFGRSDKPTRREDYTYQRHVDWVRALLVGLDLRDVTLLCQDWGGLVGLRLVGEHPERFAKVIAANTFLPTGDKTPPPAFFAWREFSQTAPEFPTSNVIQMGSATPLDPRVLAAYDAPYPDESYKAGARQFPTLVPVTPDDPASVANRLAWESLEKFERPFLCAFGNKDPITKGADKVLIEKIPGTRGVAHTTIVGGGHFLQEDCGEELGRVVAGFVKG